MMLQADELGRTRSAARIELNPADAERLGIADGETATVAKARASAGASANAGADTNAGANANVTGIVRVTADVAPGAVFVPLRAPGLDATPLLDRDDATVTAQGGGAGSSTTAWT